MNNKKLLIYGSLCSVVLLGVIVFLAFVLFGPGEHKGVRYSSENALCRAVPSDAVMVFDVKELSNFLPMVQDTSSFAYNLIDADHPISRICARVGAMAGDNSVPVIFSLHYSSKNEVSILAVADVSALADGGQVKSALTFLQNRKKRYNTTDIYAYDKDLNVALCDNMLIMSSSLYVVESVVRHLDNGTSILDNKGFIAQFKEFGERMALYVNHHQIGKLFSGMVQRNFLKYSDFVLRYSSWSSFELAPKSELLLMEGLFDNENEEKFQSVELMGQESGKSGMGNILPAGTLFGVSLLLSDVDDYLKSHKLFLEVHKKLSGYKYKQHIVQVEGALEPQEYIDSLEVKELVSAYCKFGDRFEWLTFVKSDGASVLGEMVSNMIDRNRIPEVMEYRYKGYVESVFGELFSHCNEESICNLGSGWQVIGPKDIVSDFASGNANYTNLDYYLNQTPLKGFLSKPGTVKVLANIKEAPDSLLQMLKPYYSGLMNRSVEYKNFEVIAMNIANEGKDVNVDISFSAARLAQLPVEKPKDESVETVVYIDSTIVVDKGPFEVVDFVKGGKQYLEQLPNNKIRLMSGAKKGIWTIPFESPLCGMVGQVDFFKNGKLQMIFASADKLYILDRVGRMVRGFPVTLADSVVLGPKIVDLNGDKNYSFLTLNEDNSVTLYNLGKEKLLKGVKIKAPEFVKELPQIEEINGKKYLFLATAIKMHIYTLDGNEVEVKDKKRVIAPQSEIIWVSGDDVRVTGKDGKEFIVNLVTGKTKKITQ